MEASLSLDASSEVRVTFVALQHLPEKKWAPLAARTRLITLSRGGYPVSPTAQFSKGARAGILKNADSFLKDLEDGMLGRSRSMTRLRGSLANGVTTVFRLQDRDAQQGVGLIEPVRKGVEIQIHGKEEDRYHQVGLVIEDLIALDEEELGEDVKDGAQVLQRETVLLDRDLCPAQSPLALVIPSPFGSSPARALVAVIDSIQQVEDAVDPRFETFEKIRTPAENPLSYEPALQGLSLPAHQRQTLLYLAEETRARFAADLALTAARPILDSIAQCVREKLQEGSHTDPAALGWVIESCSYTLLTKKMTEEGLSPELEGLLARHAGEAGRDAATLGAVLSGAQGLKDLDARLLYENLLFLEDTSPSARCRAFDWLVDRNQAPPGYDPLDSRKKRRQALEQAAAAKTKNGSGEEVR
jgi:hypothetical protein